MKESHDRHLVIMVLLSFASRHVSMYSMVSVIGNVYTR
jgi:hypothetical protein